MTRRPLTPPSLHRSALPMLSIVLAALALVACTGGNDSIRVTAASPTPTPQATATPEPTEMPAAVPERPANPFTGGTAVGQYLQTRSLPGGGADLDGCLPELVAAWDLTPVEGERCLLADLDGDGREEYVFLLTLPGEGEEGRRSPGDLWFFDDERRDYRFYHSARGIANAALYDLEVVAVRDLTGDERVEVIATWEACDGDSCRTHLVIASHHHGPLENLAPSTLAIAALEEIEITGEGRVVLRGGVEERQGAGPQRGRTTQLAWAGSQFRATERLNDPEYLVHLVNDADDAYARGDYALARELFEAAAANNELRDWKAETGQPAARAELRAYALFRAGLAAQREGDREAHLALIARAADQATLHGSAAERYRRAIADGASSSAACSELEGFLGQPQLRDLFNAFWDYGTANPERSVFTICR